MTHFFERISKEIDFSSLSNQQLSDPAALPAAFGLVL
jgi:hypothetical protein